MDSLEYQVYCGLYRAVVFKDAECFLRPENLPGGNVPTKTSCMAQLLCFSQVGLAPPQSIFGAPSVLNIDTRSIPLNDFSVLVEQGHLAVQHVAIFPVSPPHAGFKLERFSASQGRAPFAH